MCNSSTIWFDPDQEFSEDNVDTYMRFMLEPPTSQRFSTLVFNRKSSCSKENDSNASTSPKADPLTKSRR
eukprot:CAMPEP_0198733072 /NCGR_PEP_ID=MMETSP1475-20131203/42370_1 /TAXON_ID= ORGANISM="Unidentified sp., Strain CCMP1999" /NCGR_SAMPLE_ID=MMETSP1475 /ASSEMBLY_ACC=CAM_ASM_001111 /LENGTH=69 /DNA_ID=CAMNT_0044496303 /DNA_START=427 /DNA_END=636 /DNA_ORIENTATION=+